MGYIGLQLHLAKSYRNMGKNEEALKLCNKCHKLLLAVGG